MSKIGARGAAQCAAFALLTLAAPAAAQHTHASPDAHGGLQIPEPMRIEHEAIHGQLEAATRAPDPLRSPRR